MKFYAGHGIFLSRVLRQYPIDRKSLGVAERPEWNLLSESIPVKQDVSTLLLSKWKWYGAFLELEVGNTDEAMYFLQRIERVFESDPLSDCSQKTRLSDSCKLLTRRTLEEQEAWML
jgi:hypothetical protein